MIRTETEQDYAAVYEINQLAFNRHAEALLVESIRASSSYLPELSLVAEQDGRLVGHILFSLVTLAALDGDLPLVCLAPLAVLPAYQRQGIGARLVLYGLEECRRLGHTVVNVLGHPEYYPRFGFQPARPMGILPPFDVPDEAWMIVELQPGALAGLRGVVRYPPAFNGV
jgi:putative acetyltransferase